MKDDFIAVSDAQLEYWREYAKRDDCHFVPSDIRCLIGDLIRAREKLGECHAGYETLRKELAAAREALEHAERFFKRILVAFDNPIPVDAKNSLWSDRADYMAKCARAGEERMRAALGKRGEG